MVKKFFLLLLIFSFHSIAQDDIETQFNLGISYYNTQQYDKALEIFTRISSSEEFHSRSTLSLIFKGKTELKLERFREAEDTFQNFLERYPGSNYSDEARLSLSKAYYEQKKFYDTVKELTNIIRLSNSPSYISDAKSAGEKIALQYLSPSLIQTQIDLTTNNDAVVFLKYILAVSYYKNEEIDAAKKIIQDIINNYPAAEEKIKAESLLKRLSEVKEELITTPLVAALIPLSGEKINFQSLKASQEILEGFKYAVAEYNSSHEDKIGLLIRDTEMLKDKIKSIRDEFEYIPQIKAILGPVFSSEVRETIEEFNGLNIPIISPTATDNDLTALNSYFFQANPAFSIRGKIIAQYIFYVENKRKMTILNAIDGYSPLLGAVFKEEFKNLGGEILADETYKSNTFSFENPVREIARLSANADGIYLPLADKIDAPALLSELSQHNININIYGNQDWMMASGFESASQLSNRLTFTSDYFIDYNNTSYIQFSKDFFARTQTGVNRNVLYGYDAAKYLLDAMSDTNKDRESIKNKMEAGFAYNGFHNNIAFDVNRINLFLNIVRYRDGKFELIDKFKAGP